MATGEVLGSARTVLLVDFPSREVPDALVRSGLAVTALGGPGPEDYFSYELVGDEVREAKTGRPPEQADVIYVHRPVNELPSIVATAGDMGTSAVWCETGSDRAREIVETAGLTYVDTPSIVEAAHRLRTAS